VIVQAPPTHAEMLVRNLIENAVKYAETGGCVRVRIAGASTAPRLDIFNACAPLPEWNPDKLFEPFYRPDFSRNSKTGGAGLGLAICKAIADANGWTLTLQQEPAGVTSTVLFQAKSRARRRGDLSTAKAAGARPR
jgi:two-component system sensor histidine kinase BaeS